MKRIIILFASVFCLNVIGFSQDCFGTLHWTIDSITTNKHLLLPPYQLCGETFAPKDTIWPLLLITNKSGRDYGAKDSMNLDVRWAVFNEQEDTLYSLDLKIVSSQWEDGVSYNRGWTFAKISLNGYPDGEYTFRAWIRSTKDDGIYCDSIQELSSFQAKFKVRDNVGIEEAATDNISVYPNPAQDRVTVSTGSEPLRKVQLYNMLGQNVREYATGGTASECTLDVSALPKGMYLLKIQSGKSNIVKKIAIE